MPFETPLLAKPDDPLEVGRAPRFNGTTMSWERFSRPLSSQILVQPGLPLVSSTPGQRIYNICPNPWVLASVEASLGTAAASGSTVVEVLKDGVLAATLTLAAGANVTSTALVSSIARGSYLQARITQVGAGCADLSVQINGIQIVQDGAYTAAQTAPWALYDAEAGQPKNVGYVQLSGASGDFISIPDSPEVRITGDIEFVARVAPLSWASGATQQVVCRSDSGSNRNYLFFISTSGQLGFQFSSDGSSLTTHASTVNLSATPASTPLWIKATMDADDGAGNRVVKFYTCTDQSDEPSSGQWVQLGTTSTVAGAASIFPGTRILEIGSRTSGNADRLAGKIHRVIVRNGIGGRTVADFDARNCYGPGYLNPGTLPVDDGGSKYVPLSGQSGDYVWTADKPSLRITGDIEIVARVALDDWTPSGNQAICARYDGGTNRSYLLRVNTTGNLVLTTSSDGAVGGEASATSQANLGAQPNGTAVWVKATLDVDNGSGSRAYSFFWATDQPTEPSAWTALGASVVSAGVVSIFAGTRQLEIGSRANGTTDIFAGKIHRVIVRNGIGGTKVADFDAEKATTFAQASDGVGNGWFINSPKHHGNWTLSLPKIYDTSGNGHPPAVFGAGSNQPVWMPWTGASNIRSGGGAGNALQYAASNWAPIDALVDLDVWVDVAVHSYTPAAQTPFFERRRGVDPENQFRFALNTNGTLALLWYPLGTTASTITRNSTVNLSTVCGGITGLRIALRAVLDVDNGAGGHTVSFYIRFGGYDGTWMLLESITTAGTTSMPTSGYANRRLEFGGGNAINSGDVSFYAGQLLGSIGGSAVAVMDASQSGQAGYTNQLGGQLTLLRASSGRKLVAQTAAARSARSVIQHASDDWIDVPAVAVPPLDTFQPPSAVAAVFRRWHNPGTAGHAIFTTKASLSNAALGFQFRLSQTATDTSLITGVGDGTTQDAFTSNGQLPLAMGVRGVVSSIAGNSSPFHSTRVNGAAAVDDTSRTTTVSTSTGGAGRIGAHLGGTGAIDMEFEALATYRRDPGANIHAALVAGHNGGQ